MSNEPKHTPGPWVQFVMDGECRAIMPAGRDGDICGFDLAPSEANAALMTAAPVMLAALQAQEAADAANEERLGYEKWQRLEDDAKALRVAAIASALSA